MDIAHNVSQPFDIEKFMSNVGDLQANIGRFMSKLKPVSIPEFLNYDGNWTEWLMRMEKAIQQPIRTDVDTLKWLGDWLNEITPSLASDQTWHQTLRLLRVVNMIVEGNFNMNISKGMSSAHWNNKS